MINSKPKSETGEANPFCWPFLKAQMLDFCYLKKKKIFFSFYKRNPSDEHTPPEV